MVKITRNDYEKDLTVHSFFTMEKNYYYKSSMEGAKRMMK